MPQVMKPEPRAILSDYLSIDRCRPNVVLHNHAAEPGLFAIQLGRREQEIRIFVVLGFLSPCSQ